MSEPTIPIATVIIPLHDHKAWVLDAIQSVVDQDYPRKQIVVVDDGSTDGSPEVVMSSMRVGANTQVKGIVGFYRDTDIKVMLLAHKPAQGPSYARNIGIKAAWSYTDVFCFLDSDDIYEQGKLSKSIAKWQENPELIGVVYSDYDTFNPSTGLRIREYKEPFDRYRLMQECIINCDSLVSKKALETCGLFDPQLRCAEDYDLWLRITERFLAVHIPSSLVRIRVGSHSSTSQVPQELWRANYSRVMQKLQERANGQQ